MERDLRELLVGGAAFLGVELDDTAVGRFDRYLTLLQAWGRKVNLTARLEAREIVVHHFLDSLAGARWIGRGGGGTLIDIGSGAGFPGLPLKIALPELEVLLLDSVQKKVAFCRHVVRETGLSGVNAEWGRAEERSADPALSGRFRWVTGRAVSKAAEFVALGLPFLAAHGTILLYKGKPEKRELDDLATLCAERMLSFEAIAVSVPGLDASRTILKIVRKAA